MKHSNSRVSTADAIDVLRDDIVALKKDLASLVTGRLNGLSDATHDAVARAGESVKEIAENTQEKAKAMHKSLGRAAAERPLTTVALAVAAGAIGVKLLGWLSRK